jgi:hypothetical protein
MNSITLTLRTVGIFDFYETAGAETYWNNETLRYTQMPIPSHVPATNLLSGEIVRRAIDLYFPKPARKGRQNHGMRLRQDALRRRLRILHEAHRDTSKAARGSVGGNATELTAPKIRPPAAR